MDDKQAISKLKFKMLTGNLINFQKPILLVSKQDQAEGI